MSETKSGRGRPRGKKQSNIIEIKDLKLEFISSKTDNYNNEISYLKVIDKSFKPNYNRLSRKFVMIVVFQSGGQMTVYICLNVRINSCLNVILKRMKSLMVI